MEFYYEMDTGILYVGTIIGFQGFAMKPDELLEEMKKIDEFIQAQPYFKQDVPEWSKWEPWVLDWIGRGQHDFALFYGWTVEMPHDQALALAEEHATYNELESTPW